MQLTSGRRTRKRLFAAHSSLVRQFSIRSLSLDGPVSRFRWVNSFAEISFDEPSFLSWRRLVFRHKVLRPLDGLWVRFE